MKRLALALSLVLAGSIALSAQDVAKKPQAPAKSTLTTVVNLNTAAKADLLTLPGIGPVKADRILAYRTAHGPFQAVNDLLAVKGIGAKTLDAMRSRLTVGTAKGAK